jgi:hypothetical protein
VAPHDVRRAVGAPQGIHLRCGPGSPWWATLYTVPRSRTPGARTSTTGSVGAGRPHSRASAEAPRGPGAVGPTGPGAGAAVGTWQRCRRCACPWSGWGAESRRGGTGIERKIDLSNYLLRAESTIHSPLDYRYIFY